MITRKKSEKQRQLEMEACPRSLAFRVFSPKCLLDWAGLTQEHNMTSHVGLHAPEWAGRPNSLRAAPQLARDALVRR